MNRPYKTRIHIEDRLLGIWKQIILEKRRFSQENPEIVLHLLQTLCLLLDRAIMDSSNFKGKKPISVLKMKNFIEEHAGSSLRVGDVARSVGLSESRAQHLFKECYGKTIKEYMIEIRLSMAVERMKYSSLTLTQIAESLEFSSYVHFHRLFRKKFGLSPSQYMLNQPGELNPEL
ncbi:HTH-type transcriptional activator Btr [compost metagenome]